MAIPSSWSLKHSDKLLKTVLSAVFGALLIAVQVALAPLANIELVTTLVMLFGCVLGKYAFLSLGVFVLGEGLIFGFGIWWVSYLYIWIIPLFMGMALKKFRNPFVFGLGAAVFGLLFGTLTAIPNLIMFGIENAFAYIIAGIPFDIPHAIGNGVLTTVLFVPLRIALEKTLKISKEKIEK